jgi:preprotein translocase subunit SecA
LFAYALAMPGETTRGRVRGMLRKIDSITPLTGYEAELVEFGLDERLRLHGLEPVFSVEGDEVEDAPAVVPEPAGKVGRNDPCPCGSGKKYKKCHGA